MRYVDLRHRGTQKLELNGITDASTDSEYLLLEATGITRSRLFAIQTEEAPEKTVQKYEELITRRSNHEPLQYILGNQDFMGYCIRCTPDVLIPRLDTEILVENAFRRLTELSDLKMSQADEKSNTDFSKVLQEKENTDYEIRNGFSKNTIINSVSQRNLRTNKDNLAVINYLDVCTGSGCIPIAIECMYRDKIKGKKCVLESLASDISEKALDVARENAEANGAAVRFVQSNLWEKITGSYDLITSNPPYIETEVIKGLMPEVNAHEPMIALDGGADGMDFYRRLCKSAPEYLNNGGWMLMEIGNTQGNAVAEMMTEAGFSSVRVIRDLAGLDRVVEGKMLRTHIS